jgi:chaperone BCS1
MFAGSNQFLSGGLVLMILGGLVASLRRVPMKLWEWFLRYFSVTLTVTSDDYTFNWFLLWLNKQPYVKRTRKLSVRHFRDSHHVVPGKGTHWFWWNKHLIWMNWRDDEGKIGGISEMASMVTRQTLTIRTIGRSRATILKLIEEAYAYTAEDHADKLEMFTWRGSWSSSWNNEYRNRRALTSVFLPETADDVLTDMQTFLTRQAWYTRVGIPYRRGYLFHGLPGTGKSSAVLALASTLKIPLYVLNLAVMTTDATLEQAIGSIDTDAPMMLLIEDIDTAMPKRDDTKDKKAFSLGTLLNMMDGILARENMLLIVTTNRLEVLDPALVRPGRIDKMVEFGLASPRQIQQAIDNFFPADDPRRLVASTQLSPLAGYISPARVQETLLELHETQV